MIGRIGRIASELVPARQRNEPRVKNETTSGSEIVRPEVVPKITARCEWRRQCCGAIRSIRSIPMHPNTPLSERLALSGPAPQGTKAARGTAILPIAP